MCVLMETGEKRSDLKEIDLQFEEATVEVEMEKPQIFFKFF